MQIPASLPCTYMQLGKWASHRAHAAYRAGRAFALSRKIIIFICVDYCYVRKDLFITVSNGRSIPAVGSQPNQLIQPQIFSICNFHWEGNEGLPIFGRKRKNCG